MRLIPPTRTRRWIWLAVAVALGAALVGSLSRHEFWIAHTSPSLGVGLSHGRIGLVHFGDDERHGSPIWSFEGRPQLLVPSWFVFADTTAFVFLPLGPLVLAAGACTALAFRRARRLRNVCGCGRCGYPRAGLPHAAPCPECGKA